MSDKPVDTVPETSHVDALFLELSQFTKARTARELNMKQLIVRLCRRLNKFNDDPLIAQAMDYLKRSGMVSITDILRFDPLEKDGD